MTHDPRIAFIHVLRDRLFAGAADEKPAELKLLMDLIERAQTAVWLDSDTGTGLGQGVISEREAIMNTLMERLESMTSQLPTVTAEPLTETDEVLNSPDHLEHSKTALEQKCEIGRDDMADPADYYDDVKKYAGSCDEAAVKGIVRHLGIALASKDSALVSASDPKELERLKEGFCKKKLGQSDDAAIAAAIDAVMAAMKGDTSKQRVTVCYMLAEKFGKLSTFT